MGNKNERPTVPPIQKKKDLIQFTGGKKLKWPGHVWRTDRSVFKRAFTYTEEMEEQRQRITRSNRCKLGAGIQ